MASTLAPGIVSAYGRAASALAKPLPVSDSSGKTTSLLPAAAAVSTLASIEDRLAPFAPCPGFICTTDVRTLNGSAGTVVNVNVMGWLPAPEATLKNLLAAIVAVYVVLFSRPA